MVLSHRQFNILAEEANTLDPKTNEAGFSVSLHPGPAGEIVRPTDRYMVGGVAPTGTHDAPISGRQIVGFARKQKDVFSQPEMYLGAWHSGGRKQVDLDVSQGFPRTARGSESARWATVQRGEQAYGDIDPKGGYQSHYNPFHTSISKGVSALREHGSPEDYARVVSGDVLGAQMSWTKRRPSAQS